MTATRQIRMPLALTVAALIHLAILVAIAQPTKTGSAAALGSGGVTVSLGPAGRAPGAVPSEAVPVEAEVAPPEPVEAVVEPTIAVEPEFDIVESTEPDPVDTLPVVDMAHPTDAPEPPMESAPEPSGITELPPPVAVDPEPYLVESVPAPAVESGENVEAIQPEPMVEPVQPVASPQPVQVARTVPTPPLPARRPPAPWQAAAPAPAQPAGLGGVSGDTAEADRGSGDVSSGGGAVGNSADYDALLLAWLERHKTYPRRAQMQQRQGIVRIRFVIDGQGGLVSSGIAESSGHEILDREGLATIRRAAPMPQPPPELAGGHLERVVPIAFTMR